MLAPLDRRCASTRDRYRSATSTRWVAPSRSSSGESDASEVEIVVFDAGNEGGESTFASIVLTASDDPLVVGYYVPSGVVGSAGYRGRCSAVRPVVPGDDRLDHALRAVVRRQTSDDEKRRVETLEDDVGERFRLFVAELLSPVRFPQPETELTGAVVRGDLDTRRADVLAVRDRLQNVLVFALVSSQFRLPVEVRSRLGFVFVTLPPTQLEHLPVVHVRKQAMQSVERDLIGVGAMQNESVRCDPVWCRRIVALACVRGEGVDRRVRMEIHRSRLLVPPR